MELQEKICSQETIIRDLKSKHDNNLKYISLQLFSLQRSLMEKENHLSQLIREREQVAEWSTLIGRVEILLSLVESFIELKYFHSVAMSALLCLKEPARRIQSPLLGALQRKIPAGSLWHKGWVASMHGKLLL